MASSTLLLTRQLLWAINMGKSCIYMQVVGSSAQTVPVNITQFSVASPTVTYGQNQTYGAVVTSSPLFPGPFLWQNGTQTIATLSSLSNATSQSVFLGGEVKPGPVAMCHAMLWVTCGRAG